MIHMKMLKKKFNSLLILIIICFTIIPNQIINPTCFHAETNKIVEEEELSINNPISVYGYSDIVIIDDFAYLISYFGNFHIWNISIPNESELIDYNQDYYGCMQLEFSNGLLYMLMSRYQDTPYLVAANLDNKTAPKQLSNCTIEYTIPRAYLYHSLFLSENYAYVLINWNNSTGAIHEYSLSIIDISNSTEIKEIGRYNNTGFVSDIYLKNDLIYLVQREIKSYDKTVEMQVDRGENKIEIIDVSNKTNPQQILNYQLQYLPQSIFVKDNHAFVLYYGEGFDVFDLDLIPNIQLEMSYRKNIFCVKMIFIDELYYLLTQEGLEVFTINYPISIERISKFSLRFHGEGSFQDFKILNDLAYCVRYVASFNAPFIIIDISNEDYLVELYPNTIYEAQRMFWLATICFGYVLAPVVILAIIILTIYTLLRKRRKELGIRK